MPFATVHSNTDNLVFLCTAFVSAPRFINAWVKVDTLNWNAKENRIERMQEPKRSEQKFSKRGSSVTRATNKNWRMVHRRMNTFENGLPQSLLLMHYRPPWAQWDRQSSLVCSAAQKVISSCWWIENRLLRPLNVHRTYTARALQLVIKRLKASLNTCSCSSGVRSSGSVIWG